MEQLLSQFQNDEHTREAVKAFIEMYLNKIAVERVMAREETKDLADAKEVLEGAFVELREAYGKDNNKALINKAR
jgi:hypothetical protein